MELLEQLIKEVAVVLGHTRQQALMDQRQGLLVVRV
jgi:hypothetical protein